MLVNMADPPVNTDFAGVGNNTAVEDVGEGRLSGAVLAEEGVDFARDKGQGRIRERDGFTESDGDAANEEGQKFPRGTTIWPAAIDARARAISATRPSGRPGASRGFQT